MSKVGTSEQWCQSGDSLKIRVLGIDLIENGTIILFSARILMILYSHFFRKFLKFQGIDYMTRCTDENEFC